MKSRVQHVEWCDEDMALETIKMGIGTARLDSMTAQLDAALSGGAVHHRVARGGGIEVNRQELLAWLRRPSSEAPRGPKPKAVWVPIHREALEWLADQGIARVAHGDQARLERFIEDRLEAYGESAGDRTVRRHSREIIEQFKEQIRP